MTVTLQPSLASRIDDAVASGAYASGGEVVRDALRLWEQNEEIKASELARLKAAYAEGIASGAGRAVNADSLIEGFKAKAARRG